MAHSNKSQLYAEQEEYDAEQIRHNKDGENAHHSSKRQQDISLMGKEVHRREHYWEWLATQNVLDSMRNSDIRATGYSNIPSCDKRAAYGSYPKSNDSENHDRNATPGPSRPYNGRYDNDNHDYDHDRSNSHYESLFIGIRFIKPITLFHTLIRFTVGNLLLLIME